MPPLRLPDLSRPNTYEHRRPKRPTRLPRRLQPPPERSDPPDLKLFLYVGMGLFVILALVAIPYVIAYLVEVLGT